MWNGGNDYTGKIIYIIDNIDCGNSWNEETGELLEGEKYEPIKEFNGTLDGNGYTISRLYINNENTMKNDIGLIAILKENGRIENLAIEDSYIKGNENVGGFVGINYGTISNCKANATIFGKKLVGGIVGLLRGNIDECINYGIINGNQSIGGIAGATGYYNSTNTLIKDSLNYGNIEGYYQAIGGICGQNSGGNIERCANKGNISLIGENTYYGVAGIAGTAGSTATSIAIESCYNEGTVTLEISGENSTQVAGIVGNMTMNEDYEGFILNCYNKGEIISKSEEVENTISPSGIGGWGNYIVVKNCYNIGKLTVTNVIPKGIWGTLSQIDNMEFENNYWLDSCGANYGIGIVNSNIGADVKTSDELKLLATTLGEAFKEDAKNINNGYPILQWQ